MGSLKLLKSPLKYFTALSLGRTPFYASRHSLRIRVYFIFYCRRDNRQKNHVTWVVNTNSNEISAMLPGHRTSQCVRVFMGRHAHNISKISHRYF